VLFLDELPEFNRSTLEVLRQPLEDKSVTVSRAGGKATFPTDFICIAAMNPCPCGFLGHPEKPCKDTQAQINRYRRKISGPLLDRLDIHLEIPPVPFHEMALTRQEESSEEIRQRVKEAKERLKKDPPYCSLNASCQNLLKEASETLGISARGHRRILNVAQTIACLAGKKKLEEEHLLEAISYQAKD
jgi:magnesium chelatase family protein